MSKPWKVREDGLGWEETPMKVVGRPRRLRPEDALSWNAEMLKLAPAWARKRPRGIFKFKTYEEMNEWDFNLRTGSHPDPSA